uniref:HMG box domain-containing protein n=1 Tax=Oncorhynchus tshawytscha TaxID=74940 RepID=A0A8C8IUU3_ONCTS
MTGKDPNKPKGKTSSYVFFVATCREEHKKKHPGTSVNFSEFSKKSNTPEGPQCWGSAWQMCCCLPLPPGGRPVRKSRIQLQWEVFSPRVLSLVMSFEATMVLNAKL